MQRLRTISRLKTVSSQIHHRKPTHQVDYAPILERLRKLETSLEKLESQHMKFQSKGDFVIFMFGASVGASATFVSLICMTFKK